MDGQEEPTQLDYDTDLFVDTHCFLEVIEKLIPVTCSKCHAIYGDK